MMETRLIVRYPNRRLLDVESGGYLALEELHRLVRRGLELRVLDAVSREDITRDILLIAEDAARTPTADGGPGT